MVAVEGMRREENKMKNDKYYNSHNIINQQIQICKKVQYQSAPITRPRSCACGKKTVLNSATQTRVKQGNT